MMKKGAVPLFEMRDQQKGVRPLFDNVKTGVNPKVHPKVHQ
jgi:hypothetical protein